MEIDLLPNRTLFKSELAGIAIDRVAKGDLETLVLGALGPKRSRAFVVACANPHSIVVSRTDSKFREALRNADLVLADGSGLKLGSWIAGVRGTDRITGFDFFETTMKVLQSQGGCAFFLGSSELVLSRIARRAATDYPAVRICTHSPPFGEWTSSQEDSIVQKIASERANVVWIGMTAPKQEKWAERHADRLDTQLVGSIGAVFDYYAGTVTRAPAAWRSLGLEWLYRLCGEPRRLWRRTLLSSPVFLWWCVVQRFGAVKPRT